MKTILKVIHDTHSRLRTKSKNKKGWTFFPNVGGKMSTFIQQHSLKNASLLNKSFVW